MAIKTDHQVRTGGKFWSVLRGELAPRPGRAAQVARIAANTSLVVAIAMLYQVPLPAYMAYAVFLISREEAASTLVTGLAAQLAFTMALALSLLFYLLDASEPALRLPLMAVSTFCGMFMVRTMAIGPIVFLAGFVLVLSQTIIDKIPNLEALTRLLLWIWVVVSIPVWVTILVDLAIGENPGRLARRTALRLFAALSAALLGEDNSALERSQAEAIGLIELRHRAEMFDGSLHARATIDMTLLDTLTEALTLCRMLPADTPPAIRRTLAGSCDACAELFRDGGTTLPGGAGMELNFEPMAPGGARPVVIALADCLERLRNGLVQRGSATAQPAVKSAKSLFVPDAFSNPDHRRFALKTAIAVMAAYIIYSGLDWPGISTSITTCFFVALGSFGETMHKLTLRITGAVTGGLAGGLAIVYLLPHMTDIGQLMILIAAVSAVSGWISTSSNLISYAGMQFAFAFFLGVLQGYGPATDLTVLRDRVVGILLGNLLMSIVFSVVWPVSAAERCRASVAMVLRGLGTLLGPGGRRAPGQRLAVVRALTEARRLADIGAFELDILAARASPGVGPDLTLARLDRLAGAAFTVAAQQDDPDAVKEDEATAAWFTESAGNVAKGGQALRPVGGPALPLIVKGPIARQAAIEARWLLNTEIEDVAVRA